MPVTGPDFISLQVTDLDASQAFYERFLGLVRSPAGPPHAVVFTTTPAGLADADLVVLPGTRATLADLAWLPDGICLDEQMGVWAGMPGSGVVPRIVDGGRITDVVSVPMDQGMGTAVVLGGPERRSLYVACGLEVFDWEKSRREGKGSIWVAEVEIGAGGSRP